MEAKAKKGSLLKSFAKVAAAGAMALSLSACVTTGPYVTGTYPTAGGQFGNPAYSYNQGVPRQYQITYQAPRAPWANDPMFQREVSLAHQQANNNVRQQYANFNARVATCNANYSRAIQNNQRQVERDKRDGFSWTEAMNSGTRLNVANATLNSCRVNAETAFQRSHLSQQQSFDRTVQTLNTRYARQYGVRW